MLENGHFCSLGKKTGKPGIGTKKSEKTALPPHARCCGVDPGALLDGIMQALNTLR